MALNFISAAEAASLVKHGYNIGLSGWASSCPPLLVQPKPLRLKLLK